MVIDKPESVTMFDDVSDASAKIIAEVEGGSIRVKMALFIASAFFGAIRHVSTRPLPAVGCTAAVFVVGSLPQYRPGIRMGSGIRRNFAFRQNRRFFHLATIVAFFKSWLACLLVSLLSLRLLRLDYGPDNDYQYWDNSARVCATGILQTRRPTIARLSSSSTQAIPAHGFKGQYCVHQ